MSPVPKAIILDVLDFIRKRKAENSPTSYISIKNALKLFSIPIPIVTVPEGTKLFRIRVHETSDVLFKRVQDLGHRIDRNGIIGFGRANEPLQSIFYCSDVRETAFCETSKLVKEPSNGLLEETTLGIWVTKRDIRMATLPKRKGGSLYRKLKINLGHLMVLKRYGFKEIDLNYLNAKKALNSDI